MSSRGGEALRSAASKIALITAVMAAPGGWAQAEARLMQAAAEEASAQPAASMSEESASAQAAAAPAAQTRPNINPYDRDIAMTVPLNFNRRVLGEMPVLLTRDDRFIVESAGFRALIDPLLTPEAQADLKARLDGVESFAPEEINATGISLDYDPDQLAVLVLRIDPNKRSIESLFQGGRPEEPGSAPENFSAYLNTNMAVTRRQSTGDVSSPSLFLNGAMRYKSLVFEADVQGREDQVSGDYEVERRFARFVFDQPADYRRWYLGDLNVETRGRQGFAEMGGVGVTRQKQRFDSFRNNVLSGGRQLVLQDSSTVRVMRNGVFVREFRLDPGQYDLSNLPLDTGSNDIQLEIQNDSGRRETVAYSAYLDSIELEPGDYEYGAYLGVTNGGTFGSPDYSDGELAFSGFWRKAFMNRPALGLGLQASERVQNVTGQTQFILRNGARLQVDGSASNGDAGSGYAAAVSFDHFVDLGDTYDSWTVVADFTSEDYSTLGNELGSNPTSWVFTGAYSHQFTEDWTATLSASYRMGRGTSGDSYSANALTSYRFSPQWSVQAGIEFVDYGNDFGAQSDGVGATFALVWQPRYDRRGEARYSSARNSGSVRFQQSTENRVGSFGYSVASSYDDGPGTLSGQLDYIANRFDASLTHTTFGQSFSNITDEQVTSLRVGTSIATAGGKVAIGRNIYDSFAILYPHESLKDKPVIVGESFERGNYNSRSGALGPAVSNTLTAYVDQSVRYDVLGVPAGYDIGEGVRRVRPTYRSGYAIQVGSDAFVSALGRMVGNADKPAALISGRVRLVDDPTAEPELFFTNSVGRFAIQKLVPGKTYRVELFGESGAGFEFTVPVDNEGLLDLKTVTVPIDITDQ
jgi:outer membrane usher protein